MNINRAMEFELKRRHGELNHSDWRTDSLIGRRIAFWKHL